MQSSFGEIYLGKNMSQKNIEIKARCNDISVVIDYLDKDPLFVKNGLDHQTDTYYNTINGTRLKMREGNVENALVSYKRDDEFGPKNSDIVLHHFSNESQRIIDNLKDILNHSLGTLVVVNKYRHIYWNDKDNVKIHVDEVENLGNFVEIEVMDFTGNSRDRLEMMEICEFYIDQFILHHGLISNSYSDLLMNKDKL